MTAAYVWGYNNTGELGLPHAVRMFTPTPAILPKGTVDLQGGAAFTAALTSAGEVWCWGSNAYGQLGDGTRRSRRQPRRVELPGGAKAAKISAGTDHMLVVTTRGRVLAWGRNHRGQLGVGHVKDELAPRVVELGSVKTVAAGDAISAAITPTGRLVTWGRNSRDQLGLKGHTASGKDVMTPVRSVALKTPVVAVDAGFRHLVALTFDGQVHVFGIDVRGKPLGHRVPIRSSWGAVRAISAGDDHVLALTNRGGVIGWGANDLGQLGTGDHDHRVHPVRISLPDARGRAVKIRAGHRHNMVLTDRGEVYTWGDGRFGAVGVGQPDPAATSYPHPHRVPHLEGASLTGLGGGGYNCAVLADRGPAIGLKLTPADHTIAPGRSVVYHARMVDVFGHDLGAPVEKVVITAADAPGVTISARTHTGAKVTARDVGSYTVSAKAGSLVGTATLRVRRSEK